MNKPVHAEAIPSVNEVVSARERFYVPASLDRHYIVCFDERERAKASGGDGGIEIINPEVYIHWAGGGLNIPFNQAILEEAADPFSVKYSFEEKAGEVVPVMIEEGMKPAVHSDVESEKGRHIHDVLEGGIGCGYGEARAGISLSIAGQISDITAEGSHLRPELFTSSADYNLANAIGAAHARLAERAGFITSGRRTVLSAARSGAPMMLMQGRHIGSKGIINLATGTTFGSDEAAKAGLPAYNQDSWAIEAANDRLRKRYPFDSRAQQMADLIDGIGTMRVLGVNVIVVRR